MLFLEGQNKAIIEWNKKTKNENQMRSIKWTKGKGKGRYQWTEITFEICSIDKNKNTIIDIITIEE